MNPTAANVRPSLTAPGEPVPRRRWMIAALLGFGVLVNYFDRVNVSVSQSALHASFGITTVEFGYLLSAYSWTYALLQLPSGLLLDRFGVSLVGRVSSFLWSAACFGSAMATGIGSFFASRLLLGVGEAPTFPGSAKAVGYWFPERERSLATALFDGAAKLGPAVGVPLIGFLLLRFGWRWSFAATGIVSFVYFIFFCLFYRNPSADKKLTAAERKFILDGGAHVEGAPEDRARIPLAYLLGRRKVWGLVLGFGSYNYTFYLLLTWLPSYLSTGLGVDLGHSVLYTSVPWAVGTVTEMVIGGWLVNALIHRGWDASRVRQSVLVGGTALGLGIIGAANAHTPAAAVFWISVSTAGLCAASPVGWSIPALLAPERGVGTLGGIMNSCNQLAAIVAPIVTGYIAARTHSFAWAFAAAAIILLLGVASYIFLLGRIEPLPDPA
ncbi:MAG TPA: MFS transporter [Candidatus Acidoferrum sp.]|nr:MFS transporter [Candidatus Acidoferrum sp.]